MNKNYRNKTSFNFVLLNRTRKGVAIFLVLAFVIAMVPVLYMLSQLGNSQNKQTIKYQDYQLTQQVTIDGQSAMISRLRGGEEKYGAMPSEVAGSNKFAARIYKTGLGMIDQNIFVSLTQASSHNQTYTVIVDAEQYRGTPPVIANFSNYFGTIEPIQISAKADVLALQNIRCVKLLEQSDIIQEEQQTSYSAYKSAFLEKKAFVPDELQEDWEVIVRYISSEKSN